MEFWICQHYPFFCATTAEADRLQLPDSTAWVHA